MRGNETLFVMGRCYGAEDAGELLGDLDACLVSLGGGAATGRLAECGFGLRFSLHHDFGPAALFNRPAHLPGRGWANEARMVSGAAGDRNPCIDPFTNRSLDIFSVNSPCNHVLAPEHWGALGSGRGWQAGEEVNVEIRLNGHDPQDTRARAQCLSALLSKGFPPFQSYPPCPTLNSAFLSGLFSDNQAPNSVRQLVGRYCQLREPEMGRLECAKKVLHPHRVYPSEEFLHVC